MLSDILRLSAALLGVAATLTLLAAPLQGAEVTYPGAALQPDPFGYSNSLFPGTIGSPIPSGNTVTVNAGGALIGGCVYGGLATGNGDVTNNSVTITGGVVSFNVYGGQAARGSANGNSVVITGGTIGNEVRGGSSLYSSNNGNANGNTVQISGGTINAIVYGGYTSANTGSADNNVVTISDGTLKSGIFGGANFSGSGSASGNTVIISGGRAEAGVTGGFNSRGDNASGNTVIISGGTILNGVTGGIATAGLEATHNLVDISGNPDLGSAILIGGATNYFGGGDPITGNTLNVRNSFMTAKGVVNFQYYNFLPPAGILANDTMLSVSDSAYISGSTIGMGLARGTNLQPGDRITLLHSAGGLTANDINSRVAAQQGAATLHMFDLSTDANNLYATLASSGFNPRAEALPASNIAGLAFLNQGADLIAELSLMCNREAGHKSELCSFVTTSAGGSRYNTGSHVDLQGFSILTGLGTGYPLLYGVVSGGIFFEAGWSDYEAYNSFGGLPSVNSEGTAKYYGGGVLARYTMPLGLYLSASLRAGNTETSFASSDLRNPPWEGTSHETTAPYYGAHAGLGYVWSMQRLGFDLSSRYLWTRLESDTVQVAGDELRFEEVNSQRWRTGVRASYALRERVRPYAGLYYDYEFEGRAKAEIANYSIPAPELTGGTGVGELGVTLKAEPQTGFSVDFHLRGYAGVRDGGSGSLRLKWEF